MEVLVTQSCPNICKSMDCSLSGFFVHELPREEHRSGLPFPSLGGILDPGIKPGSPALYVDFLPSEPPRKPLV